MPPLPNKRFRAARGVLSWENFTGGEAIVARHLFQEEFEFKPAGKIFVSANHRPSVTANDHGFWRRVRIIPFNVVIRESEQDRNLEVRLRAEAPGILRWMVQGCLEWQRSGLKPSPSSTKATADYRDDMDHIQDFLDSSDLVFEGDQFIAKADLYGRYKCDYCEKTGIKPLGNVSFNQLIEAKGFVAKQRGDDRRRCWVGIGQPSTDPQLN